jgi:uncharacterized small protein (DUF1192 family)
MPAPDEEPVRVRKALALDDMSISELEERIEMLRSDIAACEAEIARKRAQKNAADALFGGGD